MAALGIYCGELKSIKKMKFIIEVLINALYMKQSQLSILGEFKFRLKSFEKEEIFVRGVTSGERFKKNFY